MKTEIEEIPDPEAVWNFFGLTRASYLVLPRVALQSMDEQWQRDFVKMINQISDQLPEFLEMDPYSYAVNPKDERGRFCSSKFPHYRRGKLNRI